MTSKEALCEILKRTDKKESEYTTKCAEIIVRDLEVLEQIKVKIDEEIKRQEELMNKYHTYAFKTQKLNTELLVAFNVKYTLEKIKEWLRREKNDR